MKPFQVDQFTVWIYSRSHVDGNHYYEYRIVNGENIIYDSGDHNWRLGMNFTSEAVALLAAQDYINQFTERERPM